MLIQRRPVFVARSAVFSALALLGMACSEASTPGDDDGAAGSSGKAGGMAGSTGGKGGAGTAGSGGSTAGSSNTGGTVSSAGGTTSGAAGSSSGAGGGLGVAGSSGAGGATGGAGGSASGAAGAGSGAGGSASGAGGASAGSGGGGGNGGSATGGQSGGGGTAGGGAGGGPTDGRSPGCGTPLQRPNPRTQQTMDMNGTTRYYLLDVPANTDNDTPLALVFGLHGYDMNNVAIIDLYNFTSRSNGRAITVLPQGEGPPPGDVSHWGDNVLLSTWMAGATNYDYIRALMLDLQDRYCIDLNRVFISGFSMGGFFTNSLACAHPDWFRAYAPVGAGGPGNCSNANAKPAMIIHHGTADDIVGIDSGEGTRDFWVEHNGCNQMTTDTLSGCDSYGGCPEGSPVLWCVGNWNHTISGTASANIWSFFDSFE